MGVTPTKPSLVWFKAQAPGIRNDGSSLVTFRFAELLAKVFELHLVCLPTQATTASKGQPFMPPFSSVTVVDLPHQRSLGHRLFVGGWYSMLDQLRVRPASSSIEGSRAVRRTLERRRREVGANVGVAEYWTAGGALSAMPPRTTLVVHDVEHEALDRIGAPRQSMIRRAELRACRAAARVVCLSEEDRSTFRALGVLGTTSVPVPSTGARKNELRTIATKVCFVGTLAWGPNRRGFEWFTDLVWPIVRAEMPEAELHVFGGGSTPSSKDGLVFRGFVNDLAETLSEIDVAVVPTIDGTGVKTKTIEFLEAGLPIVATTNGVRGTSARDAGARITDNPEQFARDTLELLRDEDARRDLVEAGRLRLAEYHSAEDFVERFLP